MPTILPSHFHSQRGISLLEIMLSLCIIALILLAATRYYVMASRDAHMNQAISIINEIQQGADNCAALNSCDPDHVTLQYLGEHGYISAATAALTTNPWGGRLAVGNGTGLIMAGIPMSYCQRLGTLYPYPQGRCLVDSGNLGFFQLLLKQTDSS